MGCFKFSFGVDILVFMGHFFQKLGEILFSFLVTLVVLSLPKQFCPSLTFPSKAGTYPWWPLLRVPLAWRHDALHNDIQLMTLSISTFSTMTLSITTFSRTISKCDTQHNDTQCQDVEYHYAECHLYWVPFMLSIIMLCVVMLSVVALLAFITNIKLGMCTFNFFSALK